MIKLINGDAIEIMKKIESNSVSTIVTSPPYNKKGLIGKVTPGNQVWKKFNIDYYCVHSCTYIHTTRGA